MSQIPLKGVGIVEHKHIQLQDDDTVEKAEI